MVFNRLHSWIATDKRLYYAYGSPDDIETWKTFRIQYSLPLVRMQAKQGNQSLAREELPLELHNRSCFLKWSLLSLCFRDSGWYVLMQCLSSALFLL